MGTAEHLLRVAAVVGEGSDCRRRRIGAVITYGGAIVAAAFNGPEDGRALSCNRGDCPRGRRSYAETPKNAPYNDCISIHAEIAALRIFAQLAQALMIDTRFPKWVAELPEEATMYVSDAPCPECAPELEWAGIQVRHGG